MNARSAIKFNQWDKLTKVGIKGFHYNPEKMPRTFCSCGFVLDKIALVCPDCGNSKFVLEGSLIRTLEKGNTEFKEINFANEIGFCVPNYEIRHNGPIIELVELQISIDKWDVSNHILSLYSAFFSYKLLEKMTETISHPRLSAIEGNLKKLGLEWADIKTFNSDELKVLVLFITDKTIAFIKSFTEIKTALNILYRSIPKAVGKNMFFDASDKETNQQFKWEDKSDFINGLGLIGIESYLSQKEKIIPDFLFAKNRSFSSNFEYTKSLWNSLSEVEIANFGGALANGFFGSDNLGPAIKSYKKYFNENNIKRFFNLVRQAPTKDSNYWDSYAVEDKLELWKSAGKPMDNVTLPKLCQFYFYNRFLSKTTKSSASQQIFLDEVNLNPIEAIKKLAASK